MLMMLMRWCCVWLLAVRQRSVAIRDQRGLACDDVDWDLKRFSQWAASQMTKKHIRKYIWKDKVTNEEVTVRTGQRRTLSVKEDCTFSVTLYGWTIPRQPLYWEVSDFRRHFWTRPVRTYWRDVDRRIYEELDSSGKRRRPQPSTDMDGVNMWLSASTRTPTQCQGQGSVISFRGSREGVEASRTLLVPHL